MCGRRPSPGKPPPRRTHGARSPRCRGLLHNEARDAGQRPQGALGGVLPAHVDAPQRHRRALDLVRRQLRDLTQRVHEAVDRAQRVRAVIHKRGVQDRGAAGRGRRDAASSYTHADARPRGARTRSAQPSRSNQDSRSWAGQ